jgi:hypothetical protein
MRLTVSPTTPFSDASLPNHTKMFELVHLVTSVDDFAPIVFLKIPAQVCSGGKVKRKATLAPRLSHRVSENINCVYFLPSLVTSFNSLTNSATFLYSIGCLYLKNFSGNPGFLKISGFLVFPKHCLGNGHIIHHFRYRADTKDVPRKCEVHVWSVSFAWG